MEPIALRSMQQEDLPAADGLRRLIGWNQTLQDWRRMLAFEPEGCFVALKQNQVVGAVTTITYGSVLGWIGMMLVHPEHWRQGIASRLMLRAIDYLRTKGIGCIKLDATPAGKPVYDRLGFVAEWNLTRWQLPVRPAVGAAPKGKLARDLQPQDWLAVEALDTAGFGIARPQLLRSLAQDCAAALVWPIDGAPKGSGMLRVGAQACYLGPLACSSAAGAEAIALTLLAEADSKSVYWDIPDANQDAAAIAHKLGFEPLRPLTRMCLGPNSAVGDLRVLFGIADPALG